jgi:hypothetical protein
MTELAEAFELWLEAATQQSHSPHPPAEALAETFLPPV